MPEKCLMFTDDVELEKKAAKFGHIFWTFNLPIQVWRPNKDESGNILLYMPRKERCEMISFDEFFADIEGGASEENIKDLCDVSAAIMKNFAKHIEEVGNNKREFAYYPNDK